MEIGKIIVKIRNSIHVIASNKIFFTAKKQTLLHKFQFYLHFMPHYHTSQCSSMITTYINSNVVICIFSNFEPLLSRFARNIAITLLSA